MHEMEAQAETRVRVEAAGHVLGSFRERPTMLGGMIATCMGCGEIYEALLRLPEGKTRVRPCRVVKEPVVEVTIDTRTPVEMLQKIDGAIKGGTATIVSPAALSSKDAVVATCAKWESEAVTLKVAAVDLLDALKRVVDAGGTVLTITLARQRFAFSDELHVALEELG